MATKTIKACDECKNEVESFVTKEALRYEYKKANDTAHVLVEIRGNTELCPDCAGAIIKRALLDAREPLIKRRAKTESPSEPEIPMITPGQSSVLLLWNITREEIQEILQKYFGVTELRDLTEPQADQLIDLKDNGVVPS